MTDHDAQAKVLEPTTLGVMHEVFGRMASHAATLELLLANEEKSHQNTLRHARNLQDEVSDAKEASEQLMHASNEMADEHGRLRSLLLMAQGLLEEAEPAEYADKTWSEKRKAFDGFLDDLGIDPDDDNDLSPILPASQVVSRSLLTEQHADGSIHPTALAAG